MSGPEQHLSLEQLELMADGTDTNDDAEPATSIAVEHLEHCEICQGKVRSLREAEARIAGIRTRSAFSASCSFHADWYSLAGGFVLPEIAAKQLAHAATCDACSAELREATALMSVDPGHQLLPEDARVMTQDWQRRLVLQLADQTRQGVRVHSPWHWPKMVGLVGVVIAAVMVVGTLLLISLRESPRELLAQAYTQERPFEWRMTGADYGPVRQRRGTGIRTERPTPLLEAEAFISRELKKSPDDASLLNAKGYAELLERNYDAAVDAFERAKEQAPQDSEHSLSLALALSARAEVRDQPLDYAHSIDLLSQVIRKDPNNKVAFFNRALAYSRTKMYKQSQQDWEQYLRLDSSSAWAEEAKQRLEELMTLLGEHSRRLSEPLLSPFLFASATEEAVRPRIDDYLKEAIVSWLPRAFEQSADQGSSERESSLKAVHRLAKLMQSELGDPWLIELVKEPITSRSKAGIRHLSESVRSNGSGDVASGRVHAREAFLSFAAARNIAGELRARLEEMYSVARAGNITECLGIAKNLGRAIAASRYLQIRANFLLEQGGCTLQSGNRGLGLQMVTQAEQLSRPFASLHLRAVGSIAGVHAVIGDGESSWIWNLQGLHQFWNGTYPPMRGYQLYATMLETAEGEQLPEVEFALAREAAGLASETGNHAVEAMARFRQGSAALAVRQFDEAHQEFKAAEDLFSRLPANESTAAFRVDGQISLARLELQRGDVNLAKVRLEHIHDTVEALSTYYERLHFHQLMGTIQLKLRDIQQARRSLTFAIALAEKALQSVSDDRSRLEWEHEASGAYRDLVQLQLSTEKEPDAALATWEWYAAASLRGNNVARVPSLSEFATSRNHFLRETVLVHAELADGLHIFAYDSRGVSHALSPMQKLELRALAERFVRLCANPSSDLSGLRRDAALLYESLIAPVSKYLTPDRTLVIELAPGLEIPFEALIDKNGRYVAETLRTRRTLSALNESMSSLSQPALGKVLLVAGPAGPEASGDGQTVDAEREVRAIAQRWPESLLLTGRHAKREFIVSSLRNANVFHFAGHAKHTPYGVALVLGPDDSGNITNMFASDIQSLDLHSLGLAVLAACATTRGSRGGVLDSGSLVRAFLLAGAANVVAAQWEVDSSVTANLMIPFYQELAIGNSTTDALSSVATRTRSKLPHPYYWSAFIAIGNGNPHISPGGQR